MADQSQFDRILGINFAAGEAYLVVVERPSVLLFDVAAKIAPPTNFDEWTNLSLFGREIADEAKALRIRRVVFAAPRLSAPWVYSDAHKRAAPQTAAGLALHAAEVACETLSQRSAASTLGIKPTKEHEEHQELAAKFGIDPRKVKHWKNRAAALAVALGAARRIWRDE